MVTSKTEFKTASQMSNRIKPSFKILLSEIIDYAGLFPPAKLSMDQAVANYASYRKSKYSWMLAKFIVPSSRIDEFVSNSKEILGQDGTPWSLSVIADETLDVTLKKIRDFNEEFKGIGQCDTLEMKVSSVWAIEEASERLGDQLVIYFEIPVEDNLPDLISVISIHRQRAKMRTGGTTHDAFPATEKLLKFIRACVAANVPFKFTAGLHHPIRCEKPLTYEQNAPVGKMYGFLNVFFASAFARNSLKPSLIQEILEDENPQNFAFTEDGIYWRHEHFVGNWYLEQLREKAATSFGSCSFEEPIQDLKELKLLD